MQNFWNLGAHPLKIAFKWNNHFYIERIFHNIYIIMTRPTWPQMFTVDVKQQHNNNIDIIMWPVFLQFVQGEKSEYNLKQEPLVSGNILKHQHSVD